MENWGLRQEIALSTGTSYKVTFTAKQLTGVGEMYAGLGYTAVPFFNQVITSSFVTYTYYQSPTNVTAPYDTVYFGGKLATGVEVENTFEVKDVLVEPLGEDWTVTNADATHYVEFIETGARFVLASTSPLVELKQTTFQLLANKSYKLTVDMTRVSGSVKVDTSGVSELFDATTSGTNNTRYITPTANIFLSFYRQSAPTDITFHSVSVQEVGQGWTVVNGDATHYVEFPGVGARFVAGTISPVMELQQTGIITPGKSYTVTCNIAYASGSGAIKPNVGGTNFAALLEGANTVTGVAGAGSDFDFRRDAANVDCVITNVTLTQVGSGNLERWWRMNGTEPLLITLPNEAPNGTVNDCVPSGSPIIQLDTP